MSLTIAQFYSAVSAELRRGTSLDSLIPSKVRQALKWIESQHTFIHMEHYASLLIDPNASSPRAIAPPTGFKKMLGWRILLEEAYYDIKKVDFYDVSKIEERRPGAYWQDGKDYFWLDNTPDQLYYSEMAYTAYTEIPSDTSQTLTVMNDFEALLLTETVILFAPQLRDANVLNMYKPERDEMMKAAIDADVEERQSWQGESVQYGREFVENINSEGTVP